MSKKNELLIDDGELLILQTKLAVIVGDRQAIALQQIHYWCGINQKADKVEHYTDDQWWVYNTWNEWHERNFPFWSVSTIRRVFSDLEADGLIILRPHQEKNKGAWVTINYGELQHFMEKHDAQPKVKRHNKRETQGSVQNEQTPSDQNEQGGLFKVTGGSVQSEQTLRDTENTEIPSENEKRARENLPLEVLPKRERFTLKVYGGQDRYADGTFISPEANFKTFIDSCNEIFYAWLDKLDMLGRKPDTAPQDMWEKHRDAIKALAMCRRSGDQVQGFMGYAYSDQFSGGMYLKNVFPITLAAVSNGIGTWLKASGGGAGSGEAKALAEREARKAAVQAEEQAAAAAARGAAA